MSLCVCWRECAQFRDMKQINSVCLFVNVLGKKCMQTAVSQKTSVQ